MEKKFSNEGTTSLGICLGATTLSMVELININNEYAIKNVIVKEHEGDPKNYLREYLDKFNIEDKYIAVTGRKFRFFTNIPSITEPEATEIAYEFVNKNKTINHDAIVSAGGESFIVYQIDKKGKITKISSGNKCASGTGEFFLQQIKRMNIDINEAVNLSKTSKSPHELSGRCSVFCKSDCTHALNKGENIANIAAGLAKMIAKKIYELLLKIGSKKVLIVGGTSQNEVVMDYVKEKLEFVDVPKEAPYFEALGAALWAMKIKQDKKPDKDQYFKQNRYSFDFLKPLKNFGNMVEFIKIPHEKANDSDECIIGLDVGSTTTKAIIFRTTDKKILASSYLRTNGNPVKASRECYSYLLKKINDKKINIIGLGVTGSGRNIAALHAQTDAVINEIIAHARASTHFSNDIDTIFEIGGQDAKYTFLTNSVASDYAMNEACSAGTGSFLEESAYESLGIKMEDIADIALNAENPPNFSDQCAAFISSDIKTAIQEGISKENIIAGLVYSICINYINRVKGFRQTGKIIFMQGGVCYNRAIPIAMAALTGKKIIVPPDPGLMGAYGVAIEVSNLINNNLLKKQRFDLKELSERNVNFGKSFICKGIIEKCDRKCNINMIIINDKKIPFGGACNKYYNMTHKIKYDLENLNHIEKRKELLFKDISLVMQNIHDNTIKIGLNKSFQNHTFFPLFFNFFKELGCRIIIPDYVDQTGADMGMTSFCLSGQIALGMFKNLLEKQPDYIFMPQIMEINVSKQKEYRKEYQSVCMFIQGEAFYQKATFLRTSEKPKIISPALNFMRGFDTEEKKFIKIAIDLGFSEKKAKDAYIIACQKQVSFFKAMKEEGRKILNELEKNPEKIGIVLFGRPYNAFTIEANKGVPQKFSSRGIEIIPYDFLEYELEENYKNTYWEMGQRIIKAARIVKRHPQLFGCYLTNFLCALDSIMLQHFRDLMGTKPSLTIEVDEHTADAGINTRIEAFMDIIKNYIKIKDKILVKNTNFIRSEIKVDEKGNPWFYDSEGNILSFKDKNVKVLMPSMGDLFALGAEYTFKHLGWNAQALPQCDREALDMGKSITTNKECLPIINIIGELLKYLKYQNNKNERIALFCVAAGGCCRVGQYKILLDRTIEKLQLRNIAVITLENDNGYTGLGIKFRLDAVKVIHVTDVLDDIRSAIKAMAVNKEQAIQVFNREVVKILSTIDRSNKLSFYKQLKISSKELSKIKLEKPINKAKYIGLIGEIFVRRDHFSLMGLPEKLAQNGFVMLDAPIMEWIRYTDFLRKVKMYETRNNLLGIVETFISDIIQKYHEKKIKKILVKSNLYEYELIDIKKYLEHSKHIFPWTLTGEPGLSSGASLYHLIDKYCGIINVGPFGCMNSRMTEAVLTPEMNIEGKEKAFKTANNKNINLNDFKKNIDNLPFLSIESDGNPFSQILEARLETFMLQANRLYNEIQELKK
ncbi:MAG: activase [Spirochaetes bacterium]|nr:activase [Spirochaetota bacterium]